MGQQDLGDEDMLQRAGDSAMRLLRHLSGYAAGNPAKRTMPQTAVGMTPAGELATAITALQDLIVTMQKEQGKR